MFILRKLGYRDLTKKKSNLFILPMFVHPYPPIEKMAESWCYFRFLIASNSYAPARGPMNGSVYHLQTLSPFSLKCLLTHKIGGICLLLMPAINHEIYTCYISTNICQLLCYYCYLFLLRTCNMNSTTRIDSILFG